MLRKVSIVLSVLAGLGLAVAAPANAKQDKGNQNVHVNKNVTVNRNVTVKKNVNVNKNIHANKQFVVGKKYNGNIWYGQNRHRWRGVWYAYGIGPCWINVDGLWFWNVAACPP